MRRGPRCCELKTLLGIIQWSLYIYIYTHIHESWLDVPFGSTKKIHGSTLLLSFLLDRCHARMGDDGQPLRGCEWCYFMNQGNGSFPKVINKQSKIFALLRFWCFNWTPSQPPVFGGSQKSSMFTTCRVGVGDLGIGSWRCLTYHPGRGWPFSGAGPRGWAW